MSEQNEHGDMHRREITLADGRYLIFYTFGDDEPSSSDDEVKTKRAEPEAEPQAAEERHV